MNRTKFIGVVVVTHLSLLLGCHPRKSLPQTHEGEPSGTSAVELTLPPKSVLRRADGSLEFSGHWKLKTAEGPKDLLPIGAQLRNSTIIQCWPSKRACEEYRAQIVGESGYLFPSKPLRLQIESSEAGWIVAANSTFSDVRIQLQIDLTSQEVEMEFHRKASAGRSRVFERWVLE